MGGLGRSGGCLCGAVRFTAAEASVHVHACHCGMCRRWGGGPALAADVRGLTIEDETHLVRYRSSDWAERAFCARCGTHLFYRIVDTGETNVNAGAFDDDTRLKLTEQIFVDAKPGWYDFANATTMKTGEEVFAAAQERQP